MAATAVTLNDLEGHSQVASLFKCNPSNICAAIPFLSPVFIPPLYYAFFNSENFYSLVEICNTPWLICFAGFCNIILVFF